MSRPIVDFRAGSSGAVEEAEEVSPTAASKGAGAWQVKLLVEFFARCCVKMTRVLGAFAWVINKDIERTDRHWSCIASYQSISSLVFHIGMWTHHWWQRS